MREREKYVQTSKFSIFLYFIVKKYKYFNVTVFFKKF